ncbi:MAG TPA: ribosome silencing factor [Chloroflexota bacterium]|nr:ribosome silencing factor [Chloroflexota bacterium]
MQQQQRDERGVFDAASVARKIVDVAVDRKASDVTLVEVGKVTTLADYFVIATGNSERQLRAVANAIREAMKEDGITLLREEGPADAGWILLDYGQVIVHLFSEEQRAYYDLERRWVEAPTLLRIQ